MKNEIINDLFDYENRKIYQDEAYFKFSLDSILLSEFVNINKKTENILDLCTGNASIPLILSTKTKATIDCFEIQEYIYELGKKSIELNKMEGQINIYKSDIKKIDELVSNKKYDIITCNPPYFKVFNDDFINDQYGLAIARHEITITLEDIFKIASSHLNDKKEFYLVHQCQRLDEIIILADKYKLNVKRIILVKTKKDNKPSLVLVKCVKNAKYGMIISDICIEGLTSYKDIFKEV